jgi:hypothetical protein
MHVLEPQADLHKPIQHCFLRQQLALALCEDAVQVTWQQQHHHQQQQEKAY